MQIDTRDLPPAAVWLLISTPRWPMTVSTKDTTSLHLHQKRPYGGLDYSLGSVTREAWAPLRIFDPSFLRAGPVRKNSSAEPLCSRAAINGRVTGPSNIVVMMARL